MAKKIVAVVIGIIGTVHHGNKISVVRINNCMSKSHRLTHHPVALPLDLDRIQQEVAICMAMKGELHILRVTVVNRDMDQLAQIVFVPVRRRARRSTRAERHCEGNLIPLQRRMRLPQQDLRVTSLQTLRAFSLADRSSSSYKSQEKPSQNGRSRNLRNSRWCFAS